MNGSDLLCSLGRQAFRNANSSVCPGHAVVSVRAAWLDMVPILACSRNYKAAPPNLLLFTFANKRTLVVSGVFQESWLVSKAEDLGQRLS